PVGEALRRVERPGLVERARRTGLDAERAGAAVEVQRRCRLKLAVRDERPEHDPRSEPTCDQQRVLAVEPDARAGRRLAVDMLVLVHEHAIGPAEAAAERVQLLA